MVIKDNDKEEDLLILSDDSDSDFKIDDDIIIDDDINISDSLISFDDDINQLPLNEKKEDSSDDFSFSFDDSDESNGLKPNIEESQDNDKEEDLLILSDDSDSDVLVSEAEPEAEPEPEPEFELEPETETDTNPVSETVPTPDPELDISLDNFDESLKKEETNFLEDALVNSSTGDEVGTMSDILSDAILKAEKRKLLIESDIIKRDEYISEFKKEIIILEEKVGAEDEEVSKLNIEKQSILKNIKSLEKMKIEMDSPAETKNLKIKI